MEQNFDRSLLDDTASIEIQLSVARFHLSEMEMKSHLLRDEIQILEHLLETRRKRLDPEKPESQAPQNRKNGRGRNGRVMEWVAQAVAATGSRGLSAAELVVMAAKAGYNLRNNYKYVVLSRLVEQDRAVRNGKRYFSREAQNEAVNGNGLLVAGR